MYLCSVKHIFLFYNSIVSESEFFVKFDTKLVEPPLRRDLANDIARCACMFAPLFQFANREFRFDFELRFFGTAIYVLPNVLFYFATHFLKLRINRGTKDEI